MGEEAGKECDKLAFMTEGDSREASLLRDLAMPDLLQQAFHEVHEDRHIVTVTSFVAASFSRGTVHKPDFLLQCQWPIFYSKLDLLLW